MNVTQQQENPSAPVQLMSDNGTSNLMADDSKKINLTQARKILGVSPNKMSKLVTAEPDVEKLAVPVASNLLLIPGHIALAEVDIKLFSQINRDTRLARAIQPFADDVDFVIIDCPPSLGMATVNALSASTDVVI